MARIDPPEFEPGSTYDYSDTDNLVLGFLIEQVTRNTYEEELRSRIIEPLGLTDTTSRPTSSSPSRTPRGYQFDPEDGAGCRARGRHRRPDRPERRLGLRRTDLDSGRHGDLLRGAARRRAGPGSPARGDDGDAARRRQPTGSGDQQRRPRNLSLGRPMRRDLGAHGRLSRASARSERPPTTAPARSGWWSTRPSSRRRPNRRCCEPRSWRRATRSTSRWSNRCVLTYGLP